MFTPHNMSHVTYHMSCVMCHMSRLLCHMSHVTCHVSNVMCHMLLFFLSFWGGAKSLSLLVKIHLRMNPNSHFQLLWRLLVKELFLTSACNEIIKKWVHYLQFFLGVFVFGFSSIFIGCESVYHVCFF